MCLLSREYYMCLIILSINMEHYGTMEQLDLAVAP